jgi:hypothetical protein
MLEHLRQHQGEAIPSKQNARALRQHRGEAIPSKQKKMLEHQDIKAKLYPVLGMDGWISIHRKFMDIHGSVKARLK